MTEPITQPEFEPMELLHTMIAQGAGNTPDAIMLRLLWLRQEHSGARVTTELLHIADDRVVIRAIIALPEGGAGSGIAASTISGDDDWAAQIEGTETIAISRALDTLGYVLRAASRPSEQSPAPPVEKIHTPAPRVDSATTSAPEQPHPTPNNPPASPPQSPQMQESAPPVVNALRRARRPQTSESDDISNQGDEHLEEYSWSSFWSRARELGLTPDRVTEILGHPANATTPREAIAALVAAGSWPEEK